MSANAALVWAGGSAIRQRRGADARDVPGASTASDRQASGERAPLLGALPLDPANHRDAAPARGRETDAGRAAFKPLWAHSGVRRDLGDRAAARGRCARRPSAPRRPNAELKELEANGPLWQLKINCLRYCRFVHLQHSAEDVLLFPRLRRDRPGDRSGGRPARGRSPARSDQLDEVEAAAAQLTNGDARGGSAARGRRPERARGGPARAPRVRGARGGPDCCGGSSGCRRILGRMLRAPIRLGLQIPNFNFPGVSEEQLFERLSDIAATAESSGFDTVLVMDHLHQIRGVGPPENWMLEGNTILAGARRADEQGEPQPARRRGHLPEPRAARQDHDHARRHLRRPRDPRHRRRLERGRGHRLRLRLPAAGRALRAARGPPQHRAGDVHRRSRRPTRASTTASDGAFNNPQADPRRHPDHDRRQRREEDAADGGPVRRRVELLRRPRPHAPPLSACSRATASGSVATLPRSRRRGSARSSSRPPRRRRSAGWSALRAAHGHRTGRRHMVAVGDPDTVAEKASELLDAGLDGADLQLPPTSTSSRPSSCLGRRSGPLCSDVPSGRSSVG